MTGKPFIVGALASAVALAAAYPVFAGNGWNSSSHGFGYRHYDGGGSSVGYSGPVTHVRRVGTFSRSVWVFHRDRARVPAPVLAPKATITHVDSNLRVQGAASACSYEAGVCVIRGN
ncbi:hypothetical protein [Rhizobium halophilum]|uniref:hypothetical protein n=1 Tax=Rhizobium halophilum TaxID=2846852 RepID=UPI001EFD0278|nr:hypothetical protein [Rhizobium halophilum]MCF6368849.1 hypothetical protein [Rhizobium halophilum]